MAKRLAEIKNDLETELAELRLERQKAVSSFKKVLEEEKITQIKSSLLNK